MAKKDYTYKTVKQASIFYGVPIPTIYGTIRNHNIPTQRIDKKVIHVPMELLDIHLTKARLGGRIFSQINKD